MKLKYYLRGLGIGVIITAIIMMISTSGKETKLTDEEIIKRAEQLGMVMKEEETETTNSLITENDSDDEQKKQTGSQENISTPEYIMIEVLGGEYSDKISQKIYEAGLVTDAKIFNDFLIENGYDEMIIVGKHQIPQGSQMEEIAKLLCQNPDEINSHTGE